MNKIKALIIILIINSTIYGQTKEELDLCLILQETKFSSNRDAENSLSMILDVIGASQNFVLAPCENIDNAVAIAYKGVRYILYDNEFINQINNSTNDWSGISILAHEVGHHINGHSLDIVLSLADVTEPKTLSQRRKQEIEADEFAGFIMAKLGAPMDLVKQTLAYVSSEQENEYSTHPSRSKRLAAIENGYKKANGVSVAKTRDKRIYKTDPEPVESVKFYATNTELTTKLVNEAVALNTRGEYNQAGNKLFKAYQFSPRDTIYMYYAASSFVNGGDYVSALKYYRYLASIGYNGSEVEYSALNKKTGEREIMPKDQRDLLVKGGKYINPDVTLIDSKQPEIIKNIALIYTQLGKDDLAMNAYVEARKKNPNDTGLILNQANLYYKQGDKETFKSLLKMAAIIDPRNPDLHYNVGVVNMEQGSIEEARVAFRKAIDLSPNYINAYLNLSTSYVNEGNALIDEMTGLGGSRSEVTRYEELNNRKQDLFEKAANALEIGLVNNFNNTELLSQLKNIYEALGDNKNYKRIEKLLKKNY